MLDKKTALIIIKTHGVGHRPTELVACCLGEFSSQRYWAFETAGLDI